ncbi:hypothetical protein EXIGLDRAFT_828485 [Exidia glandulosa HHB12029]|uniref:Uncharacterized protein n=1 Tax=Exidia glandulosa HHB12029 TaxID=1314781 RepID=A0A165QHT1_EXIGL|nr:hypothetical protein EXIGLDRAFT_828485 [Exidia glandulosa HHB12029]
MRAATPAPIPPTGRRIPMSAATPFPGEQHALRAPCVDVNGAASYIGTAIIGHGAYPCKIIPSLNPACRLSSNGQEVGHVGRYDLLPFDPSRMEFVRAAHGALPRGRRPVHGGHEEDGRLLYHAVATFGNVRVPGRTAEHLGGAYVPFNGREYFVQDYEILCWRF